ncbi:DUF4376 domain-containing protein [Stutzerimonas kunmingensis]|uniref:DUF4376 domain-containing protein n=1 Tax=Stutzerimonas kunmingensis TaxID=1211807 RepID=UPI0028A7F915|nr:DUF4376 domain-containing protein [Stutzerimonas kunmingensis]
MPFYKRENNELHAAPLFVSGPGFELTAENKDQHSYPVEGWHWFDTLDEAMAALKSEPELTPRELWKLERDKAVAAIKVTTAAGNTFDGDETSQARMARKIAVLQATGPGATADWVLADNSVATLGAQELQEALALASAEQDRIWLA